MRLHELQEKRSKAVSEMRGIADKIEAEERDYHTDEDKRHKELKAEIADLDAKIQRAKDLQEAERTAPAIVPNSNIGDGAYEDRAREVSVVRAIQIQCGDAPYDGLEREISKELSTRTGRSFNGIGIPDQALETRTLTTGNGAASLVPTQHRPEQFIDMRRSAMVTGTLGATVLDGLVGDQSIPRQIQSSTAQHVAEDGGLTETDADVDDISLTPHTVGALTSFSRRSLLNAQPSVERLVRNDLAAVVGRGVDYQAIFGDGTNDTPTGVVNVTGVYEASLSTPSWAEVLDFIAGIEAEDADIGAMGWVSHPKAVKALRSTLKVSGDAGGGYLMEQPGNLAGYSMAATTAVPVSTGTPDTTSVLFGAWSQLLIGMWSGIDLLANPYSDTAFPKGRVQVRAMQDYDIAVRHAESFAVASDLAVSE
ncbi:MAG: phage major capsid protein [Pseudomonadota bacterium]